MTQQRELPDTPPAGRPAEEGPPEAPSGPGTEGEAGQTTTEPARPVQIAHELPRHPTREVYDRELREIKDVVLRMGSLVEDALRNAIRALETHDADAATAVILQDARINAMQRELIGRIATTIATQQPVASDLRFLLSLDHVAYELERMGDHAGSVAKQARKLAPEPPLAKYVHLPKMGLLAADQVHAILRAVVDIDVPVAREVAQSDDEIDALYHRTFDRLLELMREDPGNVDRGARLLFAAHYVERIGDRVTNIAEDIVFLATGEVEDLNP